MQDGRLRPSGPTMQVVLTSRTPELDASLPEREPPCSRPCICPCTFQEDSSAGVPQLSELVLPSRCLRSPGAFMQLPLCSQSLLPTICLSSPHAVAFDVATLLLH